MDRGRDGHQGTRISLVRKRASLIRRGVGVDESFAPGASLKDLSAEEYSRLSTLWDESIEMAPEQLDAWLAAEPYVTGKVWENIQIIPCKISPMFLKQG